MPPYSTQQDSAPVRAVRALGWVLGRSLYPFSALALILGTLLWGPWVTLILGLTWWKIVTRVA